MSTTTFIRKRMTITGVVQGVGFRPFVYSLALENELSGFVGNDSAGVFVEIEGTPESLDAFEEGLTNKTPPLAVIETISSESLPFKGESGFTIVKSEAQIARNTLISPDICTCDQCLHEVFNPDDRRAGYPFTNCTNCGPRFTIIEDIPYDRPLTTMKKFTMCSDCQAEYDNPLDRRFHAQPNACHVCGPLVWLEKSGDTASLQNGWEALQNAKDLLHEDWILAIKGLGGFHLACDGYNDDALRILRDRKGRVDKPFAVMTGSVPTVREFAHLSQAEEDYLTSKERPILLLRKKSSSTISKLVARGNNYIGVMLPYTPLHYLLLHSAPRNRRRPPSPTKRSPSILVMTSANNSDEPIVKDNDEARNKLSNLADYFLFHNRQIHTRCDDSVIRILPPRQPSIGDQKSSILPIRRSRGYAPFPVRLPFPIKPILATGGELKATFCLADEGYAYMSQHIGDMQNLETLDAFESAVQHFQHIFRIQPEKIVCDSHPGYLSTRWALMQEENIPVTKVQHHHAHIAAVMAENQHDGRSPVIGFSFDGTGYGTDGAIWGGEVLIADYQGFERTAHLDYMPLAGGDAAIKRPYRLALSYLWALDLPWEEYIAAVAACPAEEKSVLRRQLKTGLNVVNNSSMGRLFDVVSALIGIRQTVTYEGQAAIELESISDPAVVDSYPYRLADGIIQINQLLMAVLFDLQEGAPAAKISARFHNTIANMIAEISVTLRRLHDINTVALSGGVFQNITLLRKSTAQLHHAGFDVLTHQLVPPNDGGLALGQAIIASFSPPPILS